MITPTTPTPGPPLQPTSVMQHVRYLGLRRRIAEWARRISQRVGAKIFHSLIGCCADVFRCRLALRPAGVVVGFVGLITRRWRVASRLMWRRRRRRRLEARRQIQRRESSCTGPHTNVRSSAAPLRRPCDSLGDKNLSCSVLEWERLPVTHRNGLSDTSDPKTLRPPKPCTRHFVPSAKVSQDRWLGHSDLPLYAKL